MLSHIGNRLLLSRSFVSSLSVVSASTFGLPASSSRGYAVLTRRRRKELRKDQSRAQREVLSFARLFDPLRAARAGVFSTLHRLGWRATAGEVIGEGLVVDFALADWAVAVDVVPGSAYVQPGDEGASNDAGWGPGVLSPTLGAPLVGASALRALEKKVEGGGGGAASDSSHQRHRITSRGETAYGSAPPSWLSPVRGLVLDIPTATRHAAIRARAWTLVVVPQPLFDFAASKPRGADYAIRDLIMSLVLPLAPFEARAAGAATGRASGNAKAWHAGQSAAAAAAEAKARISGTGRAAAAAERNRLAAQAAAQAALDGPLAERAAVAQAAASSAKLDMARLEAGVGRNRRARAAARAHVRSATEGSNDATLGGGQ